jgi:hypothetical protein
MFSVLKPVLNFVYAEKYILDSVAMYSTTDYILLDCLEWEVARAVHKEKKLIYVLHYSALFYYLEVYEWI